MSITLYGPAASSYVRTARMTCVEKGVPHTLEPIELGSPAHAQLHPWNKVPILRDGDVVLFETSAIARYVDETGKGPTLLPATPAARGVMEQWISAINCYLYDSLIRNYSLQYVIPKLSGREPDLHKIAAGVPALERGVGLLDAAYAKGPWIAGETLSLADLFVAPIIATVAMFPEGKRAVAAAKHLGRAFEKLAQRESFAHVHAGLGG